jgi:hypothetical protein
MVIFSDKHSYSGNSLLDDDFITRGWHKIPKEGDKSAEEICITNVTDLKSDNGDNGLCIIHWQLLSFSHFYDILLASERHTLLYDVYIIIKRIVS